MENQKLNLGRLTLEEFVAIFDEKNQTEYKKNEEIRIELKKNISKKNNGARIVAIIQPLLEIYYYSEHIENVCTFDKINAVWNLSEDTSKDMSTAGDYIGSVIHKKHKDKPWYGSKILEEIKNVKECSVEKISRELIKYSKENGRKNKNLTERTCIDIYGKMGINVMGKQEGNESENIKDLKDLISNGATQIILTGAPGTGKTRMAKKVAEECECCGKLNDKNYEFVQFHPSYDYTDFVEGLRPIEDKDKDGNTTMVFRKVDGIFKKFCRDVEVQNKKDENKKDENNKKKKYFFLIDEINRADLSKVFGELMFCLETDKRGKGNAVQTQYQNLPTYDVKEKKYYGENEDIFANGFYIPENVIIIGTMNDIDRSVESMDFALRRRFIWKEVEVTRDLLKNSLKGILGEYKEKYKCNFECNKVAEVIADSIMNLNNEKLKDNPNFGKHYFISQGQFANLPGNIINQAIDAGEKAEDKTEAIAKSLISSVWDLRLESLLYEYIRGEGDEQDFVEECKKALESREEKESTQA